MIREQVLKAILHTLTNLVYSLLKQNKTEEQIKQLDIQKADNLKLIDDELIMKKL